MDSHTIRQKYLAFFQNQKHQLLPVSPLIPENDPTTLFTSAGMQQLIPYLKGESHLLGTRLTNSQPCFRSQDIEEVGDNRHTTFFEMLGNWSLGDYFKKDQITWFFQFLTSEIGLDPNKLYVSVFAGDKNIETDEESIKIWLELFKTDKSAQDGEKEFDPNCHVYTYDASKNWWSRAGKPDNMPVGEIGGADSEVFYDFDPDNKLGLHQNSPYANKPCHPNCDCGRFLEIGNSVFMQFIKTDQGFSSLPKQNVDFGGGLERLTAVSQNQSDIFETDLFSTIIAEIESQTGKNYQQSKTNFRIIADHIKAATFMIAQGLEPSNKQQGYILRRLIRRSLLKIRNLTGSSTQFNFSILCQSISDIYQNIYPELASFSQIAAVIQTESDRFAQTLEKGLREFSKTSQNLLSANLAFHLYESYGFPLEISIEEAQIQHIPVEENLIIKFEQLKKSHADKSRTATKGMFKGGLAGNDAIIVKYHTATHLLHQALRKVLGEHISQAGSNLTIEKLRFDFTHPQKLTPEELSNLENLINNQISQALPVTCQEMSLSQAKNIGALAFFAEKYGEIVKVYSIGDFSREVCGGPHVTNTSELGHFHITKQEKIGSGKIRLYATLQ